MLGIKVKRRNPPDMSAIATGRRQDVNLMHGALGHPSEQTVRATAALLGVTLTGSFVKCESCAIAKIRQKNVPKTVKIRTSKPGELVHFDVSSIKTTSAGGSKYWLLFVDDYTSMKWSRFLKTKDEISSKGLEFLGELKVNGVLPHRFRCDNAPENISFDRAQKLKGHGVRFEYTSPNTPQQNGVVERAFATLYGRTRAAFTAAGFTAQMKQKLWAEGVQTSTRLCNSMVQKSGLQSSHKLFYGQEEFTPNLFHRIGEMAVIAKREPIKAKMADRGKTMVFVGYSQDHAKDVYRFYNTVTRAVVQSRDVIWLEKLYGEYVDKVISTTNLLSISSVIEDDQKEKPPITGPKRVEETKTEETKKERRLRNALRKLSYEKHPGITEDGSFFGISGLLDLAFASLTGEDPTTYEQAVGGPNGLEWQQAIDLELRHMKDKTVWKIVKKSSVPPNRRLIGTKWVFKTKRDGRRRARVNGQGFYQVPGVDYQESFSPVVHEVTIRIMILFWLIHCLSAMLGDVETAFLYGELEEEIYMRAPKGLVLQDDECLLLLKAIYGLVQASRQWRKKLISVMKKIGFKVSAVDPCLMYRQYDLGIVLVAFHIDDLFCVGPKKALEEVTLELKTHFAIKFAWEVTDYVGCNFKRSSNGNKLLVSQPELINTLKKIEIWEEDLKSSIPARPGTILPRVVDDTEIVSAARHRSYREAVGKLLYLATKSRPEVCNAVRELSKHLDRPSEEHIRAANMLINYVLNTKDKVYVMHPQKGKEWILEAMADSDYSGDKDSRLSILGYVVFLRKVAISWRSKAQRSVTLSTSEAEYVAITECVQEMLFVRNLLLSIGITVELPAPLFVDNVGAIFIAKNASTKGRQNTWISDSIFTKNTLRATFLKHRERFVCDLTGEDLQVKPELLNETDG